MSTDSTVRLAAIELYRELPAAPSLTVVCWSNSMAEVLIERSGRKQWHPVTYRGDCGFITVNGHEIQVH